MKTILYVDDSSDALFFMRAAFARVKQDDCRLETLDDASAAMTYLATQEHPVLIITDLNMPGISGFDFLGRIRSTPDMADVPVFVLTTSNLPADATRAAKLGANAVFVKPGSSLMLIEMLQRWVDQVERPRQPSADH